MKQNLTLPKNKLYSFTCILVIIITGGCLKKKIRNEQQTIVQVSTIDALMQGVYDGNTTLANLSEHGNFGIGTFNSLDGEMVLLDGIFYQVKSDGKIYKPDPGQKTPFTTVTLFDPEFNHTVSKLTYSRFKTTIDSLMISQNLFYAIKLHGNFKIVKTRSVPAQKKPYKKLTEVAANQPEFETENVRGTLSGFYSPPFMTGINVPGYHLHFISEDEKFGGHVLEFVLNEGVLYLDQINNFRLILPEDGKFLNTRLDEDLSEEIKKVEGN